MVDKSPESFFGLIKGISAPYLFAILAIIFESVVTITLSIFLQDKAYLIVETIRGLLLKFKIFLFFKPFEPDLAGIIQIIFFFFIKTHMYKIIY